MLNTTTVSKEETKEIEQSMANMYSGARDADLPPPPSELPPATSSRA